MLWTPGRALEDSRYRRLGELVRQCVSGLEVGMRPVRSLAAVPTTRWYQPITFFDRELSHSTNDLCDLVLQRVEQAVGQARRDLWDRGADPELGFNVLDAVSIRGETGWAEGMPDLVVYLEWRGPKPSFWPHKLRAEDAAKKDDDFGMDRDYDDIVGKPWAEFMADVKRQKEGGNGSA